MLWITLASVPLVSAAPQTQPFPDVSFKVFSTFVEQTFGSSISLATVLLLLFTMTENPELLSLHARQQHPAEGENKVVASGWIRSMSRAIIHRLNDDIKTVFRPGEYRPKQIMESSKKDCGQFPTLQFKQFMLFVLIALLVLINSVLLEPFCK
jgi:hypothetical protein